MINATHNVLMLIAGAALAGLLVMAARRLARVEPRVYAVGLVAAALVYAAGATLTGVGAGLLLVEWLGVAVFGALAAAGERRPGLLATGWTLHVAWDLAFPAHHTGELVPAWYPVLCVGFDLALAGYIVREIGGKERAFSPWRSL